MAGKGPFKRGVCSEHRDGFGKSKVRHFIDLSSQGLPGSWTLKMTTGNLICRSTDVAYQVPKCGEPGMAGTEGELIQS